MPTIAALCVMAILAIAGILLIRTWRFGHPQPEVPAACELPVEGEAAARRLADLLRHPTVSWQEAEKNDRRAFQSLHAALERHFPRVHARLRKETVAEWSLLYTWQGSDPDLPPVLLMAHQDVVPVPAETAGGWTHPPFSGAIADGFVWGRGALDVKSALAGIMEAAERLLEQEFQPRRTLLFAFGHDEEVGGAGNRAIAERLRADGIRLALVLDEGGSVFEGVIPGVTGPAALVGIAEKGYLSLKLTAHGEGGHSSMPPARTAVGRLARALQRIEGNPFPPRLDFVAPVFAHLGRRLSFPLRLIFANLWLFRPLAIRRLSRHPAMNAALRTTQAPTLLQAGVKENILPESATATVNLRLMPGETAAGAAARVRRTIGEPLVDIRPSSPPTEPSPVTDFRSGAYALLSRTIRQIGPEIAVAPFLVVGATDSRHYVALSDQVFRFDFLRLGPEDLRRIHGTDERIAIADYTRMVRFYGQLIRNLQELQTEGARQGEDINPASPAPTPDPTRRGRHFNS